MTVDERVIAHIASNTVGVAMCGEEMPSYDWVQLGLADPCEECAERFKAYRRGK